MRACCSAMYRALSSPKSLVRFISLNIGNLLGVQPGERFIDVDLTARHLLHQFDARGRRSGRALDADLGQQRVESSSRGRVADAEVALQLLHVSARG